VELSIGNNNIGPIIKNSLSIPTAIAAADVVVVDV